MFYRILEESEKLERTGRSVLRIPLHPWGGARYLCTITIEQTAFRMLLDTGSPSIWVPSDRVDKSLWIGKNLLKIVRETSLRFSHEFFYQTYGAGDVSGVKATVNMNFGGMLIRSVPIGLVILGDEGVYNSPFDGIVGLGRQSTCPEHTNPVFYHIHQQGLMSRKFGFSFQNSGASFLLGDNLEKFISKDMTYIKVIDGPYWETSINWIFISNIGFSTGDHKMAFDTGTDGIHLPGDIHMAINDVLGIWKTIYQTYVFECEMLPFLPPVAFEIQGKVFQIMPKQYTKQTIIDGVAICSTRFYNTTADFPVGIMLGMSFLHSFQLIFDDHAGTVGFAARTGRSSIV
ncbi:Lysosomal aspartic protease [Clonorchis sinensis]|uniref:Lysosomal aspartic protease n=1 Tax=Clonorchis sinensis TaxID=79923 RepID=A0A3R7D2P2_CLOSI|nr:Lysosomal aspartic protease [Clonorchis sinensis]